MLDSEIASQLMQNGGVATNGEFVYLPLRLTGTGITERINADGLAYILDRRLEDFSAPEWMEQYANIPVLLTHPKDGNGEPIRASIDNGLFVGNTIASFIKGSEIWVIAKLFDRNTIELIMDRASQGLPISTSPHFKSQDIKQDDSEIYLEKPEKINHLAIVERGFWDKKSTEPSIDLGDGNIINLEKKRGSMPEDQKADNAEEQKADTMLERDVTSAKEEDNADSNNPADALAKQHENLDKGDEVDKRELIKEIMAISGKPNEEFAGGEDEKVETISKLAEQLAYNPSEGGKSDSDEPKAEEQKSDSDEPKAEEQKSDSDEPKAEEQKSDSDEPKAEEKSDALVTGEYCDEDRKRDAIISKMHSLTGYAKIPYVNGRAKPWRVQQQFAKANLDLVDEEYRGLVEKIDSSIAGLADKMFDSMISKIEAKRDGELSKANKSTTSLFTGKFAGRI